MVAMPISFPSMKAYDIALSSIGWFFTGCAIGAAVLGRFQDAWDLAVISAVFLYYGRRFWKDPPSDPKV